MEFPEHDKLRAIQDKSQTVYDFLSWLEGKSVMLSDDFGTGLVFSVDGPTFKDWLAEFFGIDLDRIEAEKRLMLDSITSEYTELCGEPVTKWRLCNGPAGHTGDHGHPWIGE